MEFRSEIDTSTCEGLARLLRFAIELRANDADRAALKRIEKRFDLTPYEPTKRGALEDYSRDLEGLTIEQRFAAVATLASRALGSDAMLDAKLDDELLQKIRGNRVVRFSFAPSFLLCLLHAHENKMNCRTTYAGYEIRYSGIGSDRELMAITSLFLNLPIYTESNPPWSPDQILDDGSPNAEDPDLEISFPPENIETKNAPHLELSVREAKLSRAVDRGKYDIESVLLYYLSGTNSQAYVFTSELFLSSTKLSRLQVRQYLVANHRIREVMELRLAQSIRYLIVLGEADQQNEEVHMATTEAIQLNIRQERDKRKVGRTSAMISVDEIRSAGNILKPSRYLGTGPGGGQGGPNYIRNILFGTEHRLADYFDIIRPKTTRNDPVGDFSIEEVNAGNITYNGELFGDKRRITVRSTVAPRLEEQIIKRGDILFAHRGAIGHAAFVTDADVRENNLWAGQTLFILRVRKRASGDKNLRYCDPKVLFMYLLTPKVRDSWNKFVSDKRSRSIPIGQIESFSLPENFLLSNKPKRSVSSEEPTLAQNINERILLDFKQRQSSLKMHREIQTSMDDCLNSVWEAAWKSQ